jgi:hypothetical protein
MLTELSLTDFKAFQSERIPLSPITVLVGENNSGKSSVLAAIRLLAQTVQSADPSIPLLFDGIFGDFGSYRDVVHGNRAARPLGLGVTVESRRPRTPRSDNPGRARTVSAAFEFKYRVQRREVIQRTSKLALDGNPLLTVQRSRDADPLNIAAIKNAGVPPASRAQLTRALRMYNFLPRLLSVDFYAEQSKSPDVARSWGRLHDVQRDARSAFEDVLQALRNVEVIGAMREPPPRTFLNTGSVGSHIGVSGENWGAMVALATSGRGRSAYLGEATKWMRRAGIASALDVQWLSDRHFELVVEHPLSHEKENISDVGRGTSQVLPVILGGYRLRPGDTYLVEEPEIHLHPRAQAALGDYFADLHDRRIQSIIETHSEYLIMRLQQHIAKGRLSASAVRFYYIKSTRSGKRLQPLTLNEDAVFQQQIPGGFFPQRVTEATGLARARASKDVR